jgi:serine/threonine protein kinase
LETSARVLPGGTRLGPYRIVAFLARGGSGEVYRAIDERLDREVAIKRLPPWLADDDVARARFLSEIRLATALEHPHVLPVYDAGETDGGTEVTVVLKEIVEADSADHAGVATETPLRDTPLYDNFLRAIQKALDARKTN